MALDDLIGIAKYIARDNPSRARSFTAELRASCTALAGQPGMGRLRTDLGLGVRLFPHGNYVILFSAVNGGVLIERVLRGARDLAVAVKAPNLKTSDAMQATRSMGKARFQSAQELFDDLDKVAGPKKHLEGVAKSAKKSNATNPFSALRGTGNKKYTADQIMRMARGDAWNKP